MLTTEAALRHFYRAQAELAAAAGEPEVVPVLRGAEQAEWLMARLAQLPPSDPAWVVGGFPRWLCSPAAVPAATSDVDVLPTTPRAFDLCVELFLKEGWRLARRDFGSSSPVCDLRGPPAFQGTPLAKVQIVRPRVGAFASVGAPSAREQLSGLDFTVSRIVLLDAVSALADPHFLADEQQQRLVIRHIVCPVGSCRRISKYEAKGYKIAARERVKLFAEWSRRSVEASPDLPAMSPAEMLEEFAEPRLAGDAEADQAARNIFYTQMGMD